MKKPRPAPAFTGEQIERFNELYRMPLYDGSPLECVRLARAEAPPKKRRGRISR